MNDICVIKRKIRNKVEPFNEYKERIRETTIISNRIEKRNIEMHMVKRKLRHLADKKKNGRK